MKLASFIILMFVMSCARSNYISPYNRFVAKNSQEEVLFFAYDFMANKDSAKYEYFTGIYAYDLKKDSVFEVLKPQKDVIYEKFRYSKNDSIVYSYKLWRENNKWVNSVVRINRFTKEEKNVFDQFSLYYISNYDLNLAEDKLYFLSAREWSKSSPVKKNGTLKDFFILELDIISKEIKVIEFDFFNYSTFGFNIDRRTNKLNMNMYAYKEVKAKDLLGFEYDKKIEYTSVEIPLDTFEIIDHEKLISNKGKHLLTPGKFNGIFVSDYDDSIYFEEGVLVFKKNTKTKKSEVFYNYIDYNKRGSRNVNQIVDYPTLNKSIISWSDGSLQEVVYIVVDSNGKQIKKFLPDMSEFISKYDRLIQHTRE